MNGLTVGFAKDGFLFEDNAATKAGPTGRLERGLDEPSALQGGDAPDWASPIDEDGKPGLGLVSEGVFNSITKGRAALHEAIRRGGLWLSIVSNLFCNDVQHDWHPFSCRPSQGCGGLERDVGALFFFFKWGECGPTLKVCRPHSHSTAVGITLRVLAPNGDTFVSGVEPSDGCTK